MRRNTGSRLSTNRIKVGAVRDGIRSLSNRTSDVIDDPAIDAIYIGLPNRLYYEWALKCLKAGKHILLEKPSVSNSAEAASLFRHELLKQPNAPVLLEAFSPSIPPVISAISLAA